MASIRIIATPPGFPPEDIRDQWVGLVLPLADPKPDAGLTLRVGTENGDGYVVETRQAIEVLRAAGKEEAAAYWEAIAALLGDRLIFKKEVCVPVDEA